MANYKIKNNEVRAIIGELTEQELKAVKNYIALGYELVEVKKTQSTTKSKAEMLDDLKDFEDYKKDFELAYSLKAKEEKQNKEIIENLKKKYDITTKSNTGFHIACQIYAKWKKANKK